MNYSSGLRVPFPNLGAGDTTEIGNERIRFYRAVCLLASLLVVVFGLLYRVTNPEAFDPIIGRLAVAAAPLGLYLFSFVSVWVRAHFAWLFRGLLWALMGWFICIATVNGFAPNYKVGALFTFMAVGLAHSVGLDERDSLAWFCVCSMGLTEAGLLVAGAPLGGDLLFLSSLIGIALLLYFAMNVRLRMETSLHESEERNRAILTQTSEGVFLADTETLQIIEANPAFQKLIGYDDPEALRNLTLYDFIAQEARSINTNVQKVKEKGLHFVGERRYRHRDGTRIDVEVSADLITYAGREVLCVVVHDIRAHKETERALRQAKEQAEEMLRLKSALLNNIGHELRTPLAGILGFAEVLVEEVEGQQQEFAHLIAKNGKRLQETLDSVLDLARIESGRFNLTLGRIDLAEEVEEVVELLRPAAEQQKLSLTMKRTAPTAHATLDRAAFHRILYNLIGNAVKFTETGSVTVEVASEDGWAVVRVIDTGVGIGEDFLPHLFDEFKQESHGLERSHAGVGLGLAITSRLVDLMGGKIEVESARGEGSTFTLRFPQQPAAAEEAGQHLGNQAMDSLRSAG